MIFKSIILENFRPYCGKVKLEFCNGDKNITLLKAENGSGKTTLLEAIRWGLYGGKLDLTSGDPKEFGAASFINKKYLEENKRKASARVILNIVGKVSEDKEEQEYKITREITFENDIYAGVKLTLESKDGKVTSDKSEVHCQELINRLLPKEINFFIDGERLNKIAPEKINQKKLKKENVEAIKESVNRVLGIKSLENAILDTSRVCSQFEKIYLESNNSNKSIIELEEKLKKIQHQKQSKLKEKYEKTEEIESLNYEKEKINNKIDEILEKIKSDEKDKDRVDYLRIEQKKLEKILESSQKKYEICLSVKGMEIISSKILANGFQVIKEKKDKGEIPSRYEKEFLEELLDLKECICGASLEKDTNNYLKIIEKLKNSTSRENKEKVNEVYFLLKDIEKIDFLENLKNVKSEIYKIENKIADIDDEIKVLLENDDYNSLVVLQEYKKKLLEKEEEKITLHRSIGALDLEVENIEKQLNSFVKEKTEADKKNIKFKKERINRDFSKKILLNLETLKKYKEAQGREGLREKIEEVYSRINKKGYRAELTDDFEFKIFDNDGKEAGTGGGETKNKALAFIGGLVYYAKELNREKNKSTLDSNGGIYPLVLDAPYGDLDNEYRMDFTKMLPLLSEQIIVMVSSGQWSKTIEEVIKDKIGKKYILENKRRTGMDKRFDITTAIEEG